MRVRTSNRCRSLLRNDTNAHCAICGARKGELGGLVVHHFNGDHSDDTPSNLVILCRRCHSVIHGRPTSDKELERTGGDLAVKR